MTTKKLKDILDRVTTWPEALQDEAAARLSTLEAERLTGDLTAEDRLALERSAEDVRHGRLTAEADVADLFARFRQR